MDVKNKEKAIKFLIAKKITDLAETCLAVLGEIPPNKREGLPEEGIITLGWKLLKISYPKELFPNDKFTYDEKVISEYKGDETISSEIYANVKEFATQEILNGLKSKNVDNVLKMCDTIFKSLADKPVIGPHVSKFKNFASSSVVALEDKHEFMTFCEDICDIGLNEKSYIEKF